ncbi:hypothetical protein K439DRAFT_1625826 [Ramaria rubella]|nr:hypothetical protein K439DRAFT_1625826 [Ramaria rubella]
MDHYVQDQSRESLFSNNHVTSGNSLPPSRRRIGSPSRHHGAGSLSPLYKQYPSTPMISLEGDMDILQNNAVKAKKPTVHYTSEVNVRSGNRPVNGEEPTGKVPSLAGTDDEEFDENYDWSTDEDLVDEEAKFEHKIGGNQPRKGWGPKRIATFFLSTLVGSTLLAGVIVSVPLILHFYYLAPVRTEHRQTITDNVSAWLYWAAANILLSWYLAMIVDIIPVICNLLIGLAWGEINESVRSRIELYNAAKDKLKPTLYGASGWVSWLVIFDGIYNLYDRHNESRSRAQYTPRTYQVIQFFFFFTFVLSAEKILCHIIAFAFHRKAFNDRIESLKHDLKVIDHLRGYRPKRHSAKNSGIRGFSLAGLVAGTPGYEKSGFMFGGSSGTSNEKQGFPHHYAPPSRPITPDPLSDDNTHAGDIEEGAERGNQDLTKLRARRTWSLPFTLSSRQNSSSINVTPAVPTALADHPYRSHGSHTYPPSADPNNAFRPGKAVPQLRRMDEEDSTVIQAARALKTAVLHDARNIKGKEDGPSALGWDVNSAHEAKRLARSIYLAFIGDHRRKYLIPSDFYPAYGRHEDAAEAFRVFDKDNNGDISRAEIKTKVLKVYKERRALSKSLRDVSNALQTLDGIMIFFAMVILFFISLSVFKIAIGSSLTSFYTIGIAASFIFKNAASSAFDAVIFIFVTHPFDTGDRVFVDDENLVVKKMGLFATTFMRSDGTETYYFNSQLFTKFITNVQRSGKMAENLTIQVAWRTPLEKLDQLEYHMNEWLATEENRWFDPHTAITLQKIDYQRCLEFTMGISHNGTWQDWGLRNVRKTAFLAAVHFYCWQLDITFHNSSQPIFIAEDEKHLSKVNLHIPEHLAAPVSPRSDAFVSPKGLDAHSSNDMTSGGGEIKVIEAAKAVLGFMPPPERRTGLTRARKSKMRKGNVRGMAGGVVDGDA